MLNELKSRHREATEEIESIYFGGGTPSLLEPFEIKRFLKGIFEKYTISNNVEITLECNPEDLSPQKLSQWRALGINRLSIGVQTFNDQTTKWLNRSHNRSQAIRGINRAKAEGFKNISLDLIFALPGLNLIDLEADVEQLLDLNPNHISCYQLTLEPKTALAHQVKNGKIKLKNEEQTREAFLFLHQKLSDKGYRHYEISNYAIPGFESKHNSAYWTGEKYLGIGPSAHSFNGLTRRWNIANNAAYIKALSNNKIYFETETLSENNRFNERIMTGLRNSNGIKLSDLSGKEIEKTIEWQKQELAYIDNNYFILTPKGWLVSDLIAVELFKT